MKKQAEIEDVLPEHGLKVIQGGKDGNGGDWLRELKIGTIFLARPRKNADGSDYNGFTLLEFTAAGWYGRSRIVVEESMQTHAQHVSQVDTARFSRIMELYCIVHEPDENNPEEETETTDEQCDLPRSG